MTVNATSSAITSTSTYAPVAQTRQPEPQQSVSRPAEQQVAQPSRALPESVPSVNSEGQKIGTRISTQA